MARKDAIAKLRMVLLGRRDALRKALDGDFSALQALRDQASGDVVDFALDSAQDELNSQLAEVASRELKQIETAISMISNGTYGLCEFCQKNIPLARLQALPYASNCIECQTKVETLGEDWNREEENDEIFS